MADARDQSLPRWKWAVAIVCVTYMVVAWILPTLLLPFVNLLPFVHERGFGERMLYSSLGTALAAGTLFALDPRRVTQGLVAQVPPGALWRKLGHWLGVVAGVVMFTAGGAWLSPNVFGLLARLLPSQPYRELVVLESVDHSGVGRRRSVSLVSRGSRDGEARYLELSGRLFGDPRVAPGDVVELRGEAGPVGVYVKEIELRRSPAAPRRADTPR